MKFLVDAQLPPTLAEWLRRKGFEANAVRELGLRDADDLTIWRFACERSAIVVTKDEDFIGLATLRPGARVLWVRTGNIATPMLLARFDAVIDGVVRHFDSGAQVVELR